LSYTVSGSTASLSGAGVIERRTDKDFFSFQAGAGNATINVNGDARSPNLDVRLKIQNASGTAIANINPTDTLPASATVNLPSAGTYYVVVLGVGKGDVSGTGYSDHGSLGQYKISGTVPKP
jgi:serralysin